MIKTQEFTNQDIFIASKTVDQKILVHMVNEMFSKQFFDVCLFQKIKEIFNVNYTRDDLYKRLREIHCMSWSRMDDELFGFVVWATKELIKTATIWKEHNIPVFTTEDFIICR